MELEEIKGELRKLVPDFARRVAPVYEVLNWEWSPEGEIAHIPTAKEIEKMLFYLVEGLTDDCTGHGTGGLRVYYSLSANSTGEGGECGICFELEEIQDLLPSV